MLSADSTRRLTTYPYGRYESFVGTVIQVLEDTKCYTTTRCSAVKGTPWQEAFDLVYDRIATQYEKPTGKNAVHKFRDKITALWKAMDDAVLTGVKHGSHPLYRQACQQWHVYRALGTGKSGRADLGFLQGGMPMSPAVHHKDNAMHGISQHPILPPTPSIEMMNIWKQQLTRLEFTLKANQPSSLPSPLDDLLRIYVRSTKAERQRILPRFSHEIQRHLQKVSSNNSTTPRPDILEGLDDLRQIDYEDARLNESIHATYRHVLQQYLHLLPQSAEQE